jgi:hypothetical protein
MEISLPILGSKTFFIETQGYIKAGKDGGTFFYDFYSNFMPAEA